MNMSNRSILDEFGAALMNGVRDEACSFLQRVISGKMADKWSKALYRDLQKQKFKPEQAEFVGRMLEAAVHMGIVSFLQFLDQNEIAIVFRVEDGHTHNIQAISDGLVGELYTEDGWIEKFSKLKEGVAIEPLE
jgi:hypothetical protein